MGEDVQQTVRELLGVELFQIAGAAVTPATVLLTTLVVLATLVVARVLERAVVRLFRRRGVEDEGAIGVAGRLVNYFVLVTGVAIALHTFGLNLNALFAAGAVFAVGLGFGLQNVVQNFVSGLILLGERVIRIGDIVEVDGEIMRVEHLGMRSAVARTLDEENVILPNAQLVQSTVRNLTMRDRNFRLRAPVGVTYDSDLDQVFVALRRAAQGVRRNEEFEPVVLLTGFGSSSIDFEVSVWISDPWRQRSHLSELCLSIWRTLKRRGHRHRLSAARSAPGSAGRGASRGPLARARRELETADAPRELRAHGRRLDAAVTFSKTERHAH